MAFRSGVVVASIAVAVGVGACSVVDPVDSRYDTIGRSLAKARDEAILLNLVRASHDYPLSFVTISNVSPTLTNTTNFALPSFLLGPSVPSTTTPLFTPGRDVIFGNTTASNTTAVSTNFSVSTEETGNFYDGFLKPIDLITLDYFIRQDYPRELLFWLFADSFQLGPPGFNSVGYEYNPPVSYGCPKSPENPNQLCFKEWVLIAVLSGLTVEEQTIQKPSSQGQGGARDSQGQSGGRGSQGQNVALSTADNAGGSRGPETTIVPRFCFSPLLMLWTAPPPGT
jgi:hypothetical protein